MTAEVSLLLDDIQGREKHTEREVQLQKCRCIVFNPKTSMLIQNCPFYIGMLHLETPEGRENMI